MVDIINIEVELLMKFKKFLPEGSTGDTTDISVPEGSTLEDLKKEIGIPVKEFNGLALDGKLNEIDDSYMLENNEKITFYSTVGGG